MSHLLIVLLLAVSVESSCCLKHGHSGPMESSRETEIGQSVWAGNEALRMTTTTTATSRPMVTRGVIPYMAVELCCDAAEKDDEMSGGVEESKKFAAKAAKKQQAQDFETIAMQSSMFLAADGGDVAKAVSTGYDRKEKDRLGENMRLTRSIARSRKMPRSAKRCQTSVPGKRHISECQGLEAVRL